MLLFVIKTPKIGGCVVDGCWPQKHRFINNIYTKNIRNAIGIGARAFLSDYEGVVFYEGG